MEANKQLNKPIFTNLCFIFLLINTNLVTIFICTTFFSSSSTPCPPTTATSDATIVATSSFENKNEENELPPEFRAFTSPHKYPFGYNKHSESDKMVAPVGRPCTDFPSELRQYMTYDINGSCPDDEFLAQKLLLKGCEPLPRRRCRSAAPADSVDPYPLPDSLWTTPDDSSVVWTAYTCKNYDCLINRVKNQKGFDDCKDCFDLAGREKGRWAGSQGAGLDFSIDEVLAVKKPGTIRIGLDLGGGVATFAVRMRDMNITIVTTSMNLNGPFNNFIASRGVIPLYITISQRLPFFDNTLDLVHSMHVLSNWIPTTTLQFLLFDIHRVLRPGGLFWLDHFFCIEDQFEETYQPLFNSIGFKKIKWVVGPKLDRGPERREMYLSALLEKPLKNSW